MIIKAFIVISRYSIYGGVLEISIDWATDAVFDMLSKSQMGIINQSSTSDAQFRKSKKSTYSACGLFPDRCDHGSSSEEHCWIFVMENPNGVNIKVYFYSLKCLLFNYV